MHLTRTRLALENVERVRRNLRALPYLLYSLSTEQLMSRQQSVQSDKTVLVWTCRFVRAISLA